MNKRPLGGPGAPQQPFGAQPPLPPGPAPGYTPDQQAAHAAAWAAYYQSQAPQAAVAPYAAVPAASAASAPNAAPNPYANYGYGPNAHHARPPAAAPAAAPAYGYAGAAPAYGAPATSTPAANFGQGFGAYGAQGQGFNSPQQYYNQARPFAQPQPQQQPGQQYGWNPQQQQQGFNSPTTHGMAPAPQAYNSYPAPAGPQQPPPAQPQPQQQQQQPFRGPGTPNRPYLPQPVLRPPPARPVPAPFPPAKRPRFDAPAPASGPAPAPLPPRPRPAYPGANRPPPTGPARPPAIPRIGFGSPAPPVRPRGVPPRPAGMGMGMAGAGLVGVGGGAVGAGMASAVGMRAPPRGPRKDAKTMPRKDKEPRKRERNAREAKMTMTDFRIVGIELEAVGWRWGTTTREETEDDGAEDGKEAKADKENANAPAADAPAETKEDVEQKTTAAATEAAGVDVKVEVKTEPVGEDGTASAPITEATEAADAADAETADDVAEKRGEKRKAKASVDGDTDSPKKRSYLLTHGKAPVSAADSNHNRFRIYFESAPELDRIGKSRNPNKRSRRETTAVRDETAEPADAAPDADAAPSADAAPNVNAATDVHAANAIVAAQGESAKVAAADVGPLEHADAGENVSDVSMRTDCGDDFAVVTAQTQADPAVPDPTTAVSTDETDAQAAPTDVQDAAEVETVAGEEVPAVAVCDAPKELAAAVPAKASLAEDAAQLLTEVQDAIADPAAPVDPAAPAKPADEASATAGPAETTVTPVVADAPAGHAHEHAHIAEASAVEVEALLAESATNAASAYSRRTRRPSTASVSESHLGDRADADADADADALSAVDEGEYGDDVGEHADGDIAKRNVQPSTNRVSVLYENSSRRVVLDAAAIRQIRIWRADGKVEVELGDGLAPQVEGETAGLPKGVLVEMFDSDEGRFVALSADKLAALWDGGDHSFPPFHRAFAAPVEAHANGTTGTNSDAAKGTESVGADEAAPPAAPPVVPAPGPAPASAGPLVITVHLNLKRPLSEPKWCRTNGADEWLHEQFGALAGSPAGWRGKIVVVDPESPPTLASILDQWSSTATVGTAADRATFTASLLASPNDLLEILLRLTRGERNPPVPPSASAAAASPPPSMPQPLATAIRPDSPYASHQTHVSLAILAMYRLTTDFASRAGIKEAEVNDKIGDIVRSLPVPMIWKSLDGLFKEWGAKA
ncbi:hypothetical protein Q5752_004889 [Cryptotrichosporon argae]